MAESDTLFTNVRILDGSGRRAYAGERAGAGQSHPRSRPQRALVAPAGVDRDRRRRRDADAGHGRGAHAFRVEQRGRTLPAIQTMPLEEHTLWAAQRRQALSRVTAGPRASARRRAKPRLDVVIRNAINAGQIPGPRYLAASQEITVAGWLGDETLPHLPFPEFSFGVNVNAADEMRKARAHVPQVRRRLDQAQPVGRQLHARLAAPTPTWMSDAEVAVGDGRSPRSRGKRGTAHARSAAIGQAGAAPRHRRHLPRELHATTSRSTCSRRTKDRVFVAPGHRDPATRCSTKAEPWGITNAKATRDGLRSTSWDAALESLQAMHKRGIRVLPGGDYGFAWTPHCQNARDLEFFVKYLGFTPMEAIRSRHPLRRPDHDDAATSSARSRTAILADLLLVDGDPLANLSILRDPKRILAVMKDGVFAQGAGDRSRTRRLASAPRDATQTSGSRLVPIAALLARCRSGRWPTTRGSSSTTLLNGLTLASLYFLVASGFTLVFGLMRNVNLAHGSLYLLGAYVGWMVGESDRLLGARGDRRLPRRALCRPADAGRRSSATCRAQDLRQTLVTIGLSIVLADLMLWVFGGRDLHLRSAGAGSTARPRCRWSRSSRPTGSPCCSPRSSSASRCGASSTARASA